MAALSYLAPDFIKEGRLCWLRSPLYIAEKGNKEYYYFNDEEYLAAAKFLNGAEAKRCKGLGTVSADQARRSMFTAEYQRMDVMEYNDNAMMLLYDLMGDEVEPRYNFIMNNVDFSKISE